MVSVHLIRDEDNSGYLRSMLEKAFQSATINFLLGSGASLPAIPVAGRVEQEIDNLFKDGKVIEANRRKYEFLIRIQTPTNQLLNGVDNADSTTSVNNYKSLISFIEKLLIERKTSLLSKQANLFTTNYDLLIEKSAEGLPTLILNDGFNRTPNLSSRYEFSSQNFFNSTFNIGNLYNYKVEIPAVNLMKIHGSLSWQKRDDTVLFDVAPREMLPDGSSDAQIEEFNSQFAVVLPQKSKFEETLMDRIYYDILRIYSNELDKENTLLIVFGFSFVDEHIYNITKRALKNPALKVIVFSYSHDEIENFKARFAGNNNVEIIGPQKDKFVDFSLFNGTLNSVFGKAPPIHEDE